MNAKQREQVNTFINGLSAPLPPAHKYFDGHEARKWHGRCLGIFNNADGSESWRFADGKVFHFNKRGYYIGESQEEPLQAAIDRCGKKLQPRLTKDEVERLVDEIIAKARKKGGL